MPQYIRVAELCLPASDAYEPLFREPLIYHFRCIDDIIPLLIQNCIPALILLLLVGIGVALTFAIIASTSAKLAKLPVQVSSGYRYNEMLLVVNIDLYIEQLTTIIDQYTLHFITRLQFLDQKLLGPCQCWNCRSGPDRNVSMKLDDITLIIIVAAAPATTTPLKPLSAASLAAAATAILLLLLLLLPLLLSHNYIYE